MPRGVYERKTAEEAETAETAEPVQMFPVRLEKNYAPAGAYEVVGYHKPAVIKKMSSGELKEVEPAAFIEGQMSPPPYPGVGFPTKVWSGTVIKLPLEEAKTLVQSRRAERADAFPA